MVGSLAKKVPSPCPLYVLLEQPLEYIEDGNEFDLYVSFKSNISCPHREMSSLVVPVIITKNDLSENISPL